MLIGISGKYQSGKDTLAKYLQEAMPQFELRQFAGKLKQVVSLLTGVKIEDMNTASGKKWYLEQWGMTVGEMLQRVGTEAMRNQIHKDTWVLAAFADYTPQSNFILTDCRFPNEANVY